MKKQSINYIEYGWQESKTCAHDYLFPDICNIIKDLNVNKQAKILDAGCGGGYILHELYKLGFEDVWGFDASDTGIALARTNYPALKDRIAVHDAYDNKLPSLFPVNKFDIILSVEVIEHMYSPRDYLKNIRHWLNDGGLFIITTPYNGYMKNIIISLLNKYDLHHNPLWDGGHIKYFSKNTLYQILEEVGLKTVKFYGSGRLPFLWKSMIIAGRK